MNNDLTNSQNNIIIYTTDDGQVRIEVRLEDENVWLTQNAMAELFDTTRNNITMHIKNIFAEGELEEKSVSKESLLTAKDGKKYNTKFYNLDVIISVGYRVKSIRGTQFRIWANKLIKEYLIIKCIMQYMESAYLDVAEINALSMHAMTMKDWTNELDSFLKMTRKDILSGKGTVSHEKALEKAHKEYDRYMKTHLTKAEKDYLRILGEDVKKLK